MKNYAEEKKTLEGNEAAMNFCDSLGAHWAIYHDGEYLANESAWLSARLAEEGIDVSACIIQAVSKKLSEGKPTERRAI